MCTLAHLFSLQCTFMIMCHRLKSHLNFFLINFLPLFSILNHFPFIAKGLSSFLSFSPFIYKFTFSLSRSFLFSLLCIFLLLSHFPHLCTWFLCEGGICIWCYHAQIDLDVIITLELLLPCMFCKLTLLPSHPKIIVVLHILHIDLVAFTLYNCALLGYFHLLMHFFLFLFYFSCFHFYFCRASTHNSLFIWQLQI
jgi:hypothetical protein